VTVRFDPAETEAQLKGPRKRNSPIIPVESALETFNPALFLPSDDDDSPWKRAEKFVKALEVACTAKKGRDAAQALLYTAIGDQLETLSVFEALSAKTKSKDEASKTTLYTIRFPGSRRHLTGIKDLNTLLTFEVNKKFVDARRKKIEDLWETDPSAPDFKVVGQTYKTAQIMVEGPAGTRDRFIEKFNALNDWIVASLLTLLDGSTHKDAAIIAKMIRAKENYDFQMFIGVAALASSIPLSTDVNRLKGTFVLILEAAKAAGVALEDYGNPPIGEFGPKNILTNLIKGASRKTVKPLSAVSFANGRGQDFDFSNFLKVISVVEGRQKALKKIAKGKITIDTVTSDSVVAKKKYKPPFAKQRDDRRTRHWAKSFLNPHAMRAVRKNSYPEGSPDKWTKNEAAIADAITGLMSACNVIDYIKPFVAGPSPFSKKSGILIRHTTARQLRKRIAAARAKKEKLKSAECKKIKEFIDTGADGIARPQQDSPSEYVFFQGAETVGNAVCFALDVRDLGADLFFDYHATVLRLAADFKGKPASWKSRVEITTRTLAASDIAAKQRLDTYDRVSQVVRDYAQIVYDAQSKKPKGKTDFPLDLPPYPDKEKAFKIGLVRSYTDEVLELESQLDETQLPPLPKPPQGIHLLLGGDEVSVVCEPMFASMIGHLAIDMGLKLNARCGYSPSRPSKIDGVPERRASHDLALQAADIGLADVKKLEGRHFRLWRLLNPPVSAKPILGHANLIDKLAKLELTLINAVTWTQQKKRINKSDDFKSLLRDRRFTKIVLKDKLKAAEDLEKEIRKAGP